MANWSRWAWIHAGSAKLAEENGLNDLLRIGRRWRDADTPAAQRFCDAAVLADASGCLLDAQTQWVLALICLLEMP